MKRIFQKLVSWCKRAICVVTPGENALNGAAKVLLFIAILLLLLSAIINSINTNDAWLLLLHIGYAAFLGLLVIGINWALKMLPKIPKLLRFALMVSFFLLTILFRENLAYMIVAVSSVLGAVSFSLFKTKFKNLTLVKKIISLLGFGVAITFVVIEIVGYIIAGVDVDPGDQRCLYFKKRGSAYTARISCKRGNFSSENTLLWKWKRQTQEAFWCKC